MTYQQAKNIHKMRRIINMIAKELNINPYYMAMLTQYITNNQHKIDIILRKVKAILSE